MRFKIISQEELNKVVELHKKWLENNEEGAKADLSGFNLVEMDLSSVNLSNANLIGAMLVRANLSNSILRKAEMYYTDLTGSNLRSADLSDSDLSYSTLKWAKLSNSNLSNSDLSNSDLSTSDLSNSDLSNSNLRRADLFCAKLRGANLSGANLKWTILNGADLKDADLKNVEYTDMTSFFALQCPEEGSFIGYKKSDDKIVKLRIEEDSLRSSATSRQCRASKVTVLSITSLDGTEEFEEVSNSGFYEFTYKVGETYEVKDFDKDRWEECTTGIHFFITRDEAVRFNKIEEIDNC